MGLVIRGDNAPSPLPELMGPGDDIPRELQEQSWVLNPEVTGRPLFLEHLKLTVF